jgi:hypothetical protein
MADVAEVARNIGPLRQAAPMLEQGDLLLWSAMTIHGSLPTSGAAGARRALCARYIASAGPLARGGGGIGRNGVVAGVGGMEVLHHSDPRSLAGRAANLVRADYPDIYQLLLRAGQ